MVIPAEDELGDQDFDSVWNSVETARDPFLGSLRSEPEIVAGIIHKQGVVAESAHAAIRRSLSAGGFDCKTMDLGRLANDIQLVFPGARLDAIRGNPTTEDDSAAGYIWVNGVRYSAEDARPLLNNVRRQADGYLLRIERTVKFAVDVLRVGSENAVLVLEQQLGLLAEYIGAAQNRIVVQQVVDEMMETLLKLKSKLIEFALNFSTLCTLAWG